MLRIFFNISGKAIDIKKYIIYNIIILPEQAINI